VNDELTCKTCDHHRDATSTVPGYAECRRMPPNHAKVIGAGLALIYGLTADHLPACGEYRPRAGETSRGDVLETKPAQGIETTAVQPQSASPSPGLHNRRDRRR